MFYQNLKFIVFLNWEQMKEKIKFIILVFFIKIFFKAARKKTPKKRIFFIFWNSLEKRNQ